MNERLLAHARTGTAPRLTRAGAARPCAADPAQLEDTLAGRAGDAAGHPERTGLIADQATAELLVLTPGRRVAVIYAPAGSGKTRMMIEVALVWAGAGGRAYPRGHRHPAYGRRPRASPGAIPPHPR